MEYVYPSYEEILERMLARIPDTMDKREGSIIYDAIAPAAIELVNLYVELAAINEQTFADTATGIYLDLRAGERGIKREQATYAICEGVFEPNTIDVLGKRFNIGTFNYIVTDAMPESGHYRLRAEEAGSTANEVTGTLIPMDYIDGLVSATLVRVLIPGEEAQTDESLRKRYFQSFDSKAFGGNVADYKKYTLSIAGVGGVKVMPVWNGGGSVKLTIINRDFSSPDKTLIETVKNIIDPLPQGEGNGIAPIGHIVTIEGATDKVINITSDITYQSGWSQSTSIASIHENIDAYFKELCKKWESMDAIVVRISQIEMAILNANGVIDVENTRINGIAKNLLLLRSEIPKRGTVNGA